MRVICSADVGLRDTNTAMLGRTMRRRARVKILIIEGSKVELVDYGHVTLEVHYRYGGELTHDAYRQGGYR
jgi:hypothetical protein